MDDKVCQNLELKFDEETEQKAYGRGYEYIGTVKLNSGKNYPFYKQVDPAERKPGQLIYHNGLHFSATVSHTTD